MDNLLAYLQKLRSREIADVAHLEKLLEQGWDQFSVDEGGMYPNKLLGRMENAHWQAPLLRF